MHTSGWELFWLHFCTLWGNGDVSCIFSHVSEWGWEWPTSQQMDNFSNIWGILLLLQRCVSRLFCSEKQQKQISKQNIILTPARCFWTRIQRHRLLCRLRLFLPSNNRSRAADLHHLSWHLFNHKHWQHLKLQCMSPSVAFVTVKPKSMLISWKVPPSLQSQSKNTFISHFLRVPPTLISPKTPSHSYTLAWKHIRYQTEVISKMKGAACMFHVSWSHELLCRVGVSGSCSTLWVWFSNESCSVGDIFFFILGASLCWSVRV